MLTWMFIELKILISHFLISYLRSGLMVTMLFILACLQNRSCLLAEVCQVMINEVAYASSRVGGTCLRWGQYTNSRHHIYLGFASVHYLVSNREDTQHYSVRIQHTCCRARRLYYSIYCHVIHMILRYKTWKERVRGVKCRVRSSLDVILLWSEQMNWVSY